MHGLDTKIPPPLVAALTAAAMRALARSGPVLTTVNPLQSQAASAIVSGGIYRYTRNPLYLGLTIVLLGWSAWLAATGALLGPVIVVAFITHFQILPEERALAAKFGCEYQEYQARVRRWI